ncbi:rCG24196 [Rattus norvegicus]|uniref:RCG24196 n=1 Tax=Rattus norvegicus TaxID=10116 RepID=A6KAG1_RAT|nr:rCG24196 [Rattus norvegicus]
MSRVQVRPARLSDSFLMPLLGKVPAGSADFCVRTVKEERGILGTLSPKRNVSIQSSPRGGLLLTNGPLRYFSWHRYSTSLRGP